MYTDYLVAFLDVLGMADKIKHTDSNIQLTQEILNILKNIRTIANDINEHQWDLLQAKKINVHRFSDTIVISIPEVTINAVILLANIVSVIQFSLMGKSFFTRGAIVAGKHYEGQDDIFFGPAYIGAYELEKLARWPRVIIDTSVLSYMGSDELAIAYRSYLKRDASGLCFLHYIHLANNNYLFSKERQRKWAKQENPDMAGVISEHKQIILNEIEQIKDAHDRELLYRCHSLAVYHNNYVRNLHIDLPTSPNREKLSPESTSGALIIDFENLAKRRKDISNKEIEKMVNAWIEALYEQRPLIKACEIDISSAFDILYPYNISPFSD